MDDPGISVETNLYDREEQYKNCTVQILTNTLTGVVSVGWWENEGGMYSLEYVAEMMDEIHGDECACNFSGNDEWLPGCCPPSEDGTCPEPPGENECWKQFIKNYDRRQS